MHLNSKSSLVSRNKIFVCRLILIVSLFWVLVDVLIISLLTDRIYAKTGTDGKKDFPLTNIKFREHISEILELTAKSNINTTTTTSENGNISDENPEDWPGEQGRPVVLPKHLEKISTERFKENHFNVVVSDLIALNRSVGEQRNKKCLKKIYDDDLPNTSVIIIYHNEANSTLLRGLTSIK